jgi:hypothetical protein
LFDEGDSLDLTSDVAVLLKAHFANILKVEFAASGEFAAIAVTRPSDTVVATTSFEARVAGVLTAFDPLKEGFESFDEEITL